MPTLKNNLKVNVWLELRLQHSTIYPSCISNTEPYKFCYYISVTVWKIGIFSALGILDSLKNCCNIFLSIIWNDSSLYLYLVSDKKLLDFHTVNFLLNIFLSIGIIFKGGYSTLAFGVGEGHSLLHPFLFWPKRLKV